MGSILGFMGVDEGVAQERVVVSWRHRNMPCKNATI